MEDELLVSVPEPGYPIGALIIALINHQPRYATIHRAILNLRLDVDADDVRIDGGVGWEYEVLVHDDPEHEAENMVLAERTIIMQVEDNA